MPTELKMTYRRASSLRPYDRNARRHSKRQLKKIKESIAERGFINPIIIDETGMCWLVTAG